MVNTRSDPWSSPMAKGASGRTVLLALLAAFALLAVLGALLLALPPAARPPTLQMSTDTQPHSAAQPHTPAQPRPVAGSPGGQGHGSR